MLSFDDIVTPLSELTVEVPSWAYGNAGTRFKVFPQKGTPRTPFEKVADAAQVNRVTGLAPIVALHIPWDQVDDFGELAEYAASEGVRLGTINSNTFQDEDYKFGSLCHPDPAVRHKAIKHNLACIDVMNVTGSQDLKIWLADGTNYPGQDDLRSRQERLDDSLAEIYAGLSDSQRFVLEYKFFEPAFYHTDVPDWGTSLWHCLKAGPKAFVCLDTGHHAPGTNVEFIVMQLMRAGRLGSFDFNSRFYADDDLMVGAADPFQLFRILHQLVRNGGYPNPNVHLMLDQCHNIENHIAGQIASVLTVQEMIARALLVDEKALGEAQQACDPLAANQILMDAFYTDVRADLADWREARGLPADPVAAFWASGYQEKIEAERIGGTQASWT